jgi:hypothetical protein
MVVVHAGRFLGVTGVVIDVNVKVREVGAPVPSLLLGTGLHLPAGGPFALRGSTDTVR